METMATTTAAPSGPLASDELHLIDAYWRAANYLSVGQIYLLDNPLLTEPLVPEHVKPRLLGHWGTTPGLNLIYAHLNRVIRARDLNMIYICGPGHGGPGMVANTYLEGTYSEIYADISPDAEGMRRLFRQFSFPGGIPSHAAPETPGSIHEGGELGYALAHAFGAAFDNPDLIVATVVGDGEAETGPLAASWHCNKFLNPARDGVVLPILHLNGWKIANPTLLARIPETELADLLRGYGWDPQFVTGDDPALVHQALAGALDGALDRIGAIQEDARARQVSGAAGMAGDRPAHAEGLDGAEGSGWSPNRRVVAVPPGAAGGDADQSRLTCANSRNGFAATAPMSCSTNGGACARSWPPWPPQGPGGWEPTRTPMAACSSLTCGCRTSGSTPWRSSNQVPAWERLPGSSASSCAT